MHSRRLFFLFAMGLALVTGRLAIGQEETWVGQIVFYKEGAVAKVGEKVVDLSLVDFPAMVKEEKGEWLWLGRAWVNKKDCLLEDDALAHYSEVVKRNPKSADALRKRAACFAQKDDQAKALADLNEAIRLDPKDAKSLHARGKTKMEFALANQIGRAFDGVGGEVAGAILGGVLGAPPPPVKEEKPKIEVDELGLTKEDRTLLEEGLSDLGEAIRLDPKLAGAYFDRALAKAQMKDVKGAVLDLDMVLKLDSTNEPAFSYRADAKMELEDYAGAIRDLNEAIKLDPKNRFNFQSRASAKESLKDYRGAIADYDSMLALEAEDPFALGYRGKAKLALNDYAGALKDLDESIRLGDPMGGAKICKVFLLSTTADASVRKPDEAMTLSQEIMAGEPPQGEALSAKACALAAVGKFAEAIEMEASAAADAIWLKDNSLSGGVHSAARIAAWKAKKLWHP